MKVPKEMGHWSTEGVIVDDESVWRKDSRFGHKGRQISQTSFDLNYITKGLPRKRYKQRGSDLYNFYLDWKGENGEYYKSL